MQNAGDYGEACASKVVKSVAESRRRSTCITIETMLLYSICRWRALAVSGTIHGHSEVLVGSLDTFEPSADLDRSARSL